jgi:FtsH-binding integral membrane protein
MPAPETIYDPTPAPPDMDMIEVEKEERSFLLRVFAWMVPALLLSALATDAATGFVAHLTPLHTLFWPGWIAFAMLMFAANWVSNNVAKMPGPVAVAALLGFAFTNGAVFDLLFRDLSGYSFLPIYLSSAALFLFICIYGSQTNGDLTAFPNLAVYACVGILISLAVNRFMNSPPALQAGSAGVVLVFLMLIFSNLQFLRDLKFEFEDSPPERKAAAVGALLLYLDLVLIFLAVAQVPGRILGAASELEKDQQRVHRESLQ